MDSAEAVAAKRRVLVDALMMCLEKSKVVKVVDAKTVRGVINSAAGELWREGEFRLEPVWKLLIAQKGLSAEEVAPPLLAFKAYEKELGVQVRVPQALSAIPRGEQVRLREALGLQKADFERAIAEMKKIATEEKQTPAMAEIVKEATGRVVAGETAAAPAAKKKPASPVVAIAFGAVAVVAIGASVWFAVRDTASSFDLRDVASVVQLSDGKAAGPSLTATITDSRWESLPRDERKKLVGQVLDIEEGKGIRAINLVDGNGRLRASATVGPEGRNITVP